LASPTPLFHLSLDLPFAQSPKPHPTPSSTLTEREAPLAGDRRRRYGRRGVWDGFTGVVRAE